VSGPTAKSDFTDYTACISEVLEAESEGEMCDLAVKNAAIIFDVQLVGLWLYDSSSETLQLVSQTERADRLFGTDVVYEPGNSVSWEAFENSEVFHLSADNDADTYNEDSIVQSEIIIPIEEYGVLNIGSEQIGHFSETDIELAESFGTAVSNALEHINENHELRVKNDRLEEVISFVSHDLRNPLNAADGRIELAKQITECGKTIEQLQSASESLNRMDTLIQDLLLLADKGYVVEERTVLDLSSVAERAWDNVDTNDAELVVRNSTDVFGERKRLLQVFENLFRNAVEHGGDAVTVTVRPIEQLYTATRVGSPDETDGFIIEDDGDGLIDTDELDIFDSGTSTSGTGFGLTIVQRIVEAHGWSIDSGDSPTDGAQFRITAEAKSVAPFR